MKFHSESRKARTFWFVLLASFVAFCVPRVLCAQGNASVTQGQTQYVNGDYAGAIKTLEAYVNANPNGANIDAANLYLGCSYLALHNGENVAENNIARQYFQKILIKGSQSNTFYVDALFHFARSYYGQKDYATAKPLLRQFVVAYPEDSFSQFAFYYLGICEEDAGAIQDAISNFKASLEDFPKADPNLRMYARLELATLQGKLGQYQTADQELSDLYNTPGISTDLAGKATIQRALLALVQQKSDDALRVLSEFIASHPADSSNVATIQEAYLYEAYAYFAKKDFQNALACVDALQRLSDSLPPEAATLKIKLLLNLQRFDEAQNILNALQNSSYGIDCPDIITSHQAMIYLAQGRRDLVITSLNNLLLPRRTDERASDIYFDYYNAPNKNHLLPIDFVETCGILTMAYAGLYANSSAATSNSPATNDGNYNAQDLVFNATKKYADSLNDPAVNLVVAAIDKGRRNIISHPGSNASQASVSVLSPNYSPTPNVMGSGGFVNPNDPSQFRDPGFQNNALAPSYSGYAPTNVPNGSEQGAYGQGVPAGLPGAPAQTSRQGYPQGYPQTNPAAGTGANPLPNGQQPYGQQQGGYPQTGAPAYNATAQPYLNDPNAAQQQSGNLTAQATGAETVANATTENSPLTPREAQDALEKATGYFKNLDFDRANEILLEATTKSETFWTDCPKEAARITLLRANALFELEKYAEAQMACEDLASHAPTTTEAALANFFLGKMADSLGRPEATQYLREACAVDFPYVDVALYYLATNELEQGSVNDAAQDFERLYRDYPRSAYWSHAVWRLAKIESDLRHDRQAETLVNEALAKRPDASIIDYLLFLKGEIALRAKDYDKALVAFDMIVDQYPDSVWYAQAKNRIAAVPERFKNIDGFVDDYDYDVPAPPAPAAARPNVERPTVERSANPNNPANPRGDTTTRPRAPEPLDGFPSARSNAPSSPRRVEEYEESDDYEDERRPATGAATRNPSAPAASPSTNQRGTTNSRSGATDAPATIPSAADARRANSTSRSTAPASSRSAGTR